jgi:hypothetical protein
MVVERERINFGRGQDAANPVHELQKKVASL